VADRIAVVGVGAIGGVCAANLIATGRDVVCCVRTPFSALELTAPGASLRCEPHVEMEQAHLDPEVDLLPRLAEVLRA